MLVTLFLNSGVFILTEELASYEDGRKILICNFNELIVYRIIRYTVSSIIVYILCRIIINIVCRMYFVLYNKKE